jgi:hypothetical protein
MLAGAARERDGSILAAVFEVVGGRATSGTCSCGAARRDDSRGTRPEVDSLRRWGQLLWPSACRGLQTYRAFDIGKALANVVVGLQGQSLPQHSA